MRRDPRLVPLSREHHAALRLGRALIAGTGRDLLVQMRPELQDHFDEEERDLLPVLREAGEDTLVARLLDEHRTLNRLFDDAQAGLRAAEAGEALIAHVRFEERELFPVFEAQLEPVAADAVISPNTTRHPKVPTPNPNFTPACPTRARRPSSPRAAAGPCT